MPPRSRVWNKVKGYKKKYLYFGGSDTLLTKYNLTTPIPKTRSICSAILAQFTRDSNNIKNFRCPWPPRSFQGHCNLHIWHNMTSPTEWSQCFILTMLAKIKRCHKLPNFTRIWPHLPQCNFKPGEPEAKWYIIRPAAKQHGAVTLITVWAHCSLQVCSAHKNCSTNSSPKPGFHYSSWRPELTARQLGPLTGAVNSGLTLKTDLEVYQGHWNCCHSKACVRFPIRLPL